MQLYNTFIEIFKNYLVKSCVFLEFHKILHDIVVNNYMYSVSRIKNENCKLDFSGLGYRGKVPWETHDLWLGLLVRFFSESTTLLHL